MKKTKMKRIKKYGKNEKGKEERQREKERTAQDICYIDKQSVTSNPERTQVK